MRKLLSVLLCLFIGIGLATAQTAKVSGVVISAEDGEPIIGASVVAKGTNTGTVTNFDGHFTLDVPTSAKVLTVSYVGMKTQEVAVRPNVRVVMESASEELDEVMVVAYGTAKKSSFTGSASVVSGKEIEKLQTSNITKSLEGTVAGLQTTSNSGQPGASAQIFVRGIGSISANQNPLYVVDGVPYEGSLNSISPQDIESMTVLKDAAANSLYGSRGANGVVLITTKRGKDGKPKVNIDMRWGGNSRANAAYDVLESPAQYYEMTWESLYNQGIYQGKYTPENAVNYAQKNLLGLLKYNNYSIPNGETLIDPTTGLLNSNATLLYHNNWLDEAFTSGFRQEYNVNLSGGTQASNYYGSFGYLDDGGYVPNSKFERYTTRLKLNQDFGKVLTLGANLSYAHTVTNTVLQNSSQYSNIFMFAQNIAPIYPVYLYDQTNGQLIRNAKGQREYDYGLPYPQYGINSARPYGSMSNPLGTMRDDKRERIYDYVSGKANAIVNLPYNFKVTSNISYDLYNYNALDFMTPLAGDAASVNGRGTQETQRFTSFYFNQLINWDYTFGKSEIAVLLGHESTQNKRYYLIGDKSNFFDPYNPQFSNAASIDGLTSYTTEYSVEGYLMKADYNFDQKYYLSASYRRDASSKFAPDKRWGNFWSAGASWRITQESFMADATWVSNLKLKTSYGTQGNDGLDNMAPYQDQYEVVSDGANPGVNKVFRGNPNLTWEKSENFNVGVEFGFLDSRISGNFEYFIKNTRDMLYQKPLIPSDGMPTYIWDNQLDMRNNGIEFELSFIPVKTDKLKWTINVNGTSYKNKLTKLPSDKDQKLGYQVGNFWREKGKSIYEYYMTEFSRIDPETGSPLWWSAPDENGVRTEITSPSNASAVKLGKSALPDFFGGFSTTLEYAGFDLSIYGAYSIGGYTYDSNYLALMGQQSRSGQNWHKDILNRWTPENTNTNVPRLQNGAQVMSNAASDYFLIRSDYFSLRNITLGYTLPKSLTSKFKLGTVRVYGVADNLFLLTKRKGMDPRTDISGTVGNTYAPMRTISGGLTINF